MRPPRRERARTLLPCDHETRLRHERLKGMTIRSRHAIKQGSSVNLSKIDADYSGHHDKDWTVRKTSKVIARLSELQYLLYADKDRSVLIVLQGPDAGGKDGLIKHLFEGVNPQGVRVASFAEPSPQEAGHDFLWRVHQRAPAKGEIAVFNRSHYEAVLVERVHKLVPRDVWEARYAMINSFEELLAQNGTLTLKFYLHISPDEQLERFRQRLEDKTRQWKIDEADYEDRKLWSRFQEANEEMLERTNTTAAPWFVIPANHKWYRNYAVSKILRRAMQTLNLHVPATEVDLDDIRRKYHAAERRA